MAVPGFHRDELLVGVLVIEQVAGDGAAVLGKARPFLNGDRRGGTGGLLCFRRLGGGRLCRSRLSRAAGGAGGLSCTGIAAVAAGIAAAAGIAGGLLPAIAVCGTMGAVLLRCGAGRRRFLFIEGVGDHQIARAVARVVHAHDVKVGIPRVFVNADAELAVLQGGVKLIVHVDPGYAREGVGSLHAQQRTADACPQPGRFKVHTGYGQLLFMLRAVGVGDKEKHDTVVRHRVAGEAVVGKLLRQVCPFGGFPKRRLYLLPARVVFVPDADRDRHRRVVPACRNIRIQRVFRLRLRRFRRFRRRGSRFLCVRPLLSRRGLRCSFGRDGKLGLHDLRRAFRRAACRGVLHIRRHGHAGHGEEHQGKAKDGGNAAQQPVVILLHAHSPYPPWYWV